jgi:hypothetical protein
MQQSRYGRTDITSEYLLYPFKSPIQYNVNYTGTFSKYSIIDKYYSNSLVKPVKRLYYGGAEWSAGSGATSLTFSLTDIAYTFGDEILFKTASYPSVAAGVSDPSSDRIDAIVINEDGEIKVKAGVPSSDPKKPIIAEDEVLIQYAKILKFSDPAKDKIGTNQVVYERSGSQWTTSAYNISGDGSVSTVNDASTDNPYVFNTCVKVISDYRTGINFQMPVGNLTRSDYASLSMRVRFDEELASDRFLSVSIYGTSSTGTASSSTINLMAYGLERDIVGDWQHIVVPTIKFGSKVESIKGIKFRIIGGASSSVSYWSMDNILFQTGVDYDEYMDPSNATYTTTNITTGGSGGGGGGTFSLTVQDYLTGDQFSDIDKIIFRGNTVVVNQQPSPPGLTATGVLVTQDIPKQVIVWIPAPNYVNYINPSINATGIARYVSLPATASYTQSVASGQFGIGSWSPLSDFQANGSSVGTTRLTKNVTSFVPFTQGGPFSINNNTSTTIKFEVFREDEATAIRTITKTLTSANCGTTHNIDDNGFSGASLALGALSADQDKFKVASLTATLDMSSVLPNGGRFKCRLTHTNATEPGSPFVFNTVTFFYDNDLSTSSATVGAVSFDESVATIRKFSGIAYYGLGSTFAFTASNINLLNDMSFPTTKQIDYVPNNLAMTNAGVNFLNGHADGTKSGVGVAITGWGIQWNRSGLTFSRIGAINNVMTNNGSLWTPGTTDFTNLSGVYIPGFSPHTTNTLDASKVSSVTVRLFDYGDPDFTLTSSTKKTLIDTDVPSAASVISNPIDSEVGRLSFDAVFSNGAANFDSNVYLGSAPNLGELQYLFGRIIFPQHDFSTYMPYVNFNANCNYSALTGVSKTFDAITLSGMSSGATTPVTLNPYRWFVSVYEKSGGSGFNGGTFKFECNWSEADLHCPEGNAAATGTENLAILLGFDSTGANTTPNKFFFVSGNSGTYGGRTNGSGSKLTGVGTSNEISWFKGSFPSSIKKCWLMIGYKAGTARGKELILSDVLFVAS